MILYVIDPTEYAKTGTVISTMSAPDDQIPTLVSYSGGLYNNKGPDLTLDEYKARTNQPNLIALTWEELAPHLATYKQSLQGPWKEVTEEQYDDALECMPPQRWHDITSRYNVFHLAEAWTADIHTHYVYDRTTGKYYKALRSRHITDNQLLNQIREQIKE